MSEIGVSGESDRKRPRLESQSSEEEENDNLAFITMANEIKEETEERFKAHVQKPSRWLYFEAGQRGSRYGHVPRRWTNDVKKYLALLKTLFTFYKQKKDLKHMFRNQADGFTLKQAKEEADMVMFPGDGQMM